MQRLINWFTALALTMRRAFGITKEVPLQAAPALVATVVDGLDTPGTFIVPDIYPGDLGDHPNYAALKGAVANGKIVAGCYLKASEGLGWGRNNEAWFARGWRALGDLGIRRGAYHFLRFNQDGAAQAEYFDRMIREAGGWNGLELAPMLDVEAGGQGTWVPTAELTRLCVMGFIQRFRELQPGVRVCVYGRGIFRDLEMKDCLFGDTVCNPAYTATMPPMWMYGVPLEKISLWQCCGDGTVLLPGYPRSIPGWGATDYSVHVNGAQPTTLRTFLRDCTAFKERK